MHLASALTYLRFKFRLGVILSFSLVSFRYFAWLFCLFELHFLRGHFVFSRRKDAITPREKKRNNQKIPLEIRKDEITSDEKRKKKPHEETKKKKGFKWCYFAWPFFVLSCLFFVIYVISCGAICYFVFSPSVNSSFLFFSRDIFCFISSICLALFCLFYRAITPGRKTEKTK